MGCGSPTNVIPQVVLLNYSNIKILINAFAFQLERGYMGSKSPPTNVTLQVVY